MIDSPAVVQLPAQCIAVLRLTTPRTEIRNVMMPARNELFAALKTQGVVPLGAWFTHHLRMDPELFDLELGVPVATSIESTGRVRASLRPAMRAARTVYRGGYEGLGTAWGEFEDWIVASNLRSAPDLWECYAIGPESSEQPGDWRTEFTRPLLDTTVDIS